MSLLVEVKGLTVRYNGKKVLDNVSLDVEEGDTIGIIGRSGAGKTVLLNVLRGLDDEIPATGQVIYHMARCDRCGRIEPPSMSGKKCRKCDGSLQAFSYDMIDRSDDDTIRTVAARIAIMIQRTFGIYGDDSVIENVLKALGSVEYGGDRVMKAADLIDQVKLSHRMMHIARDLSGGEKQRVVLARQLAKEPMLLLADEPTGTLDPITKQYVTSSIFTAREEAGETFVIVSHDMEFVEKVCDRVAFMKAGKYWRWARPKLYCPLSKETDQMKTTIQFGPQHPVWIAAPAEAGHGRRDRQGLRAGGRILPPRAGEEVRVGLQQGRVFVRAYLRHLHPAPFHRFRTAVEGTIAGLRAAAPCSGHPHDHGGNQNVSISARPPSD